MIDTEPDRLHSRPLREKYRRLLVDLAYPPDDDPSAMERLDDRAAHWGMPKAWDPGTPQWALDCLDELTKWEASRPDQAVQSHRHQHL